MDKKDKRRRNKIIFYIVFTLLFLIGTVLFLVFLNKGDIMPEPLPDPILIASII